MCAQGHMCPKLLHRTMNNYELDAVFLLVGICKMKPICPSIGKILLHVIPISERCKILEVSGAYLGLCFLYEVK